MQSKVEKWFGIILSKKAFNTEVITNTAKYPLSTLCPETLPRYTAITEWNKELLVLFWNTKEGRRCRKDLCLWALGHWMINLYLSTCPCQTSLVRGHKRKDCMKQAESLCIYTLSLLSVSLLEKWSNVHWHIKQHKTSSLIPVKNHTFPLFNLFLWGTKQCTRCVTFFRSLKAWLVSRRLCHDLYCTI